MASCVPATNGLWNGTSSKVAGSSPAAPCQACRMRSSVPALRVPDTTSRRPSTSSAKSRRARTPFERPMTSPCTRGSVASRPRAPQRATLPQLGSVGPGGPDGEEARPEAASAAPDRRPTTHQPRAPPRARRRLRRRPSAAARSGGGPRRGLLGRAGRPGRRAGARRRRRGRRRAPSRPVPGRQRRGRRRGRARAGRAGRRRSRGRRRTASRAGRPPRRGRTPERPGGHDGPLERGRLAYDRLQRGAHRVVLGVGPRFRWSER